MGTQPSCAQKLLNIPSRGRYLHHSDSAAEVAFILPYTAQVPSETEVHRFVHPTLELRRAISEHQAIECHPQPASPPSRPKESEGKLLPPRPDARRSSPVPLTRIVSNVSTGGCSSLQIENHSSSNCSSQFFSFPLPLPHTLPKHQFSSQSEIIHTSQSWVTLRRTGWPSTRSVFLL